jgi:hypothetical protein
MALEPEDSARLAFDRDKWADEKCIRLQELCLKKKAQVTSDAELELKKIEQKRSKRINPLNVGIISAVAVVVVGTIGSAATVVGNIWVTNKNSNLQLGLEARKEDADLILETIKNAGSDFDKASRNLQVLGAGHLLNNPERVSALQTYLAVTKAQQEATPPPNAAGEHTLPSPTVGGKPVDICSGGLPNNDCSPTGQMAAATQVCIANGFKFAVDYRVGGGEWECLALERCGI